MGYVNNSSISIFAAILVFVVVFVSESCTVDDDLALTTTYNVSNLSSDDITLIFMEEFDTVEVALVVGDEIELGTFLSPPPGFFGTELPEHPVFYPRAQLIRGSDTTFFERELNECLSPVDILCLDNYVLKDERIRRNEEFRKLVLSFE